MTERLHFRFSPSCIGEGNGNLLQCSCLENPRDGGAWWAAVYGVTQNRTQLKWLSSSSSIHKTNYWKVGHSIPRFITKPNISSPLLASQHFFFFWQSFPCGSVVKHLPANLGHASSIPGSGSSPDIGNGNPFQYSCLGNTMDRGARRATVYGLAKDLDTTEPLKTTKT